MGCPQSLRVLRPRSKTHFLSETAAAMSDNFESVCMCGCTADFSDLGALSASDKWDASTYRWRELFY